MFLVITLLFIGLTVVGGFVMHDKIRNRDRDGNYYGYWRENGHCGMFITFLVTSIVFLIIYVILLICSTGLISIDEKIEICENQNSEIEATVSNVTNQYLQHENQTYEKLSGKEAMAAVSVYPQLSSNEVVKSQISIYSENNKKITDLKQQKSDFKLYRGLICFGY